MDLYLTDGPKMGFCWWHWGRNPAYSCSGFIGDKASWVNVLVLLQRWSWKSCFNYTLEGFACSWFRSPWKQRLWVGSFTLKMIFKRKFIGDTSESLDLFIVQVSQETDLWLNRIVLFGRWSWECHSSVTLWKTLLFTFIVQVSMETEPLSR